MARFDSGRRFDSGVRLDEASPAPSNMGQNLISQTMTDAQRDAQLADLASFDTKFTPYKVNLSAEQVKKLAKLSPSDVGLLEMALAYAEQNPNNIPANVPVAELEKDIDYVHQVIPVDASAQQKARHTRMSLVAAMSDGFVTALRIYGIAMAEGRTPDNAAFLDAFGERFKKGPQEEPEPSPTPGP
jgi:hypothetical protein